MFIDFCFDTLYIYLHQTKNVPVVFLCLLLPNEVLETTDRQYFLRSFHKVTQSDDMWSARGKLVEMVRKEKKYPPDPPSFLFLPSILLSSPTPPFLSPFDGTTLRTFSSSANFLRSQLHDCTGCNLLITIGWLSKQSLSRVKVLAQWSGMDWIIKRACSKLSRVIPISLFTGQQIRDAKVRWKSQN